MGDQHFVHNINDYIDKKFGHLTVIGLAEKTHEYSNSFLFRCDCGNIIKDQPHRVINGHKTSCGKCNAQKTKPKFDIKTYIGKKSGKLTVIGLGERQKIGGWRLHCICECGNTIDVLPYQFNNGSVRTCGCSKRKGTRLNDGRSLHPLYGIWNQMMRRCYNSKTIHYDRYGGRGITVCDEWHDFWNFVKWSDSVGGRPTGTSIDRIDNNGNYEPSNCRWATKFQQSTNKCTNVILEYNGIKKSLIEWALEYGLEWNTLSNRINRGWPVDKAITTSVKYTRKPIKP